MSPLPSVALTLDSGIKQQLASRMEPRVPKHFHFIFGLKPQTEPFHLIHYLCLRSCLEIYNPDRISFYFRYRPYGRYWEMISSELTLIEVDLVPKIETWNYSDPLIKRKLSYAHHADFLRVQLINRYGGVYADIDTLFVEPMPERIFLSDFVLGREPPVPCQASGQLRPSLCNALIVARPNSRFGRRYLYHMEQAFDGSWSDHACRVPQILSERHPSEVVVEPQRSFYKHSWTKEGIQTLLSGLDLDFHGVYSMHLWAHLWWSRWRRDFSSFHAANMTEKFIRSVDTTYTVAARRFLPERSRSSFISKLRDRLPRSLSALSN